MEQRQFDILQTLIAHPTVSPPLPAIPSCYNVKLHLGSKT